MRDHDLRRSAGQASPISILCLILDF
jgi:hypothetical protein